MKNLSFNFYPIHNCIISQVLTKNLSIFLKLFFISDYFLTVFRNFLWLLNDFWFIFKIHFSASTATQIKSFDFCNKNWFNEWKLILMMRVNKVFPGNDYFSINNNMQFIYVCNFMIYLCTALYTQISVQVPFKLSLMYEQIYTPLIRIWKWKFHKITHEIINAYDQVWKLYGSENLW